jgi:hypothetical protein
LQGSTLAFSSRRSLYADNATNSPDQGDGTYSTISDLWIEGSVSDYPDDPALSTVQAWSPTGQYQVGSLVRAPHDNRFYYECTKSGGAAPTLTAWTPDSTYPIGTKVTPRISTALPNPASSLLFEMMHRPGPSGASEPNWDLNLDGVTSDADISWKRRLRAPDPASPPLEWQKQTLYKTGDIVQASADFRKRVVFELQSGSSGRSGGTEPLWVAPNIEDNIGVVNDNGLHWVRHPVFPTKPLPPGATVGLPRASTPAPAPTTPRASTNATKPGPGNYGH